MNPQSKAIYGWERRWSVRGKMAAIAWEKHRNSGGGKRSKLSENRAFHKIISSFQQLSFHISYCTRFPNNVFHYLSLTLLIQTRSEDRGLILLVKYLARVCVALHLSLALWSRRCCQRALPEFHVWIWNGKKSLSFDDQKVSHGVTNFLDYLSSGLQSQEG